MSCNANKLWTRKALLNLVVWCCLALWSPVSALAVQNVLLTWQPSTNANVAGYKIFSGTQSGTYTSVVLVGNVTNTVISGLADGTTNYFAAKAFDSLTNESVLSDETFYAVPALTNPPGGKATASVSLGGLTQTYDGSAKMVSAVTTPGGLLVSFTYNGSASAPVNAGNYTVIGTINDANYQGGATNTLVIGRAAATMTLGSLVQTYDGTAKSVSITTVPPGLSTGVNYVGSSGVPINAGSYPVVGQIYDANYFGGVTNTLVVSKANATVNLGGLAQTYDGTSKQASITTVPAGLAASVNYAGLGSAPINAGSYSVLGTINDVNYQGDTSGTLRISQAPATVTLGALTQAFDGTARSATATTTPNGLTVTFTYDGNTNAPVNAGGYTVVGTVSDVNYFGGATNFLAITNPLPVELPAPVAGNSPPTLDALTNLSLAKNSAGVTVNLSGITSGSPNENQNLVVTAASGNTALISRVTVNYQSPKSVGTLTFKPTANAVGTATITVTVNDGGASNNLVTQTFNVIVTVPPPKISAAMLAAMPKISRQLTNSAALAGKNLILSVGVSGRAPFKYQWKRNGTNLTGASGPTLTLRGVKASQSGLYSVLVSNSVGSTNSLPAAVTIYDTPAAAMTSALQANGSFSFTVAGVPGCKYVVEASSNMRNWSAVRTNTSPFTFVDTNCLNSSQCFYRSYYLP